MNTFQTSSETRQSSESRVSSGLKHQSTPLWRWFSCSFGSIGMASLGTGPIPLGPGSREVESRGRPGRLHVRHVHAANATAHSTSLLRAQSCPVSSAHLKHEDQQPPASYLACRRIRMKHSYISLTCGINGPCYGYTAIPLAEQHRRNAENSPRRASGILRSG